MRNIIKKPLKKLNQYVINITNLIDREELKGINDLIIQGYTEIVHTDNGKKNFIDNATNYLCHWYEKNKKTDLAKKMILLPVHKVTISSEPFKETIEENFEEKISIIMSILSERKKDIIEKRRNIAAWSAIILSLILSVIGIFMA